MTSYWQTQHFKAMQSAWYAKLKDKGFEDAEELIGDEMMLRQYSTLSRVVRVGHKDARQFAGPVGSGPCRAEIQRDYFSVLGEAVQNESFASDVDRLIMSLFAAGVKIKKIIEALEHAGKRRCRMTVRMTIRKYEMHWGIRNYSPKQMNKKEQKAG